MLDGLFLFATIPTAMAIPAPQLGAMLAPTAISAGANLFRRDKASPYEQQLSRYATIFDEQATKPVTENREFKTGMKVVDAADERNRTAINNTTATGGGTDEAKIAMMGNANESRDMNINRLLDNARRYRSLMQNKALQTAGMLEQARRQRNEQFQQKLQGIVQPLGQAANAFLLSDMFPGAAEDIPGQENNVAVADASGYVDETRQKILQSLFG